MYLHLAFFCISFSPFFSEKGGMGLLFALSGLLSDMFSFEMCSNLPFSFFLVGSGLPPPSPSLLLRFVFFFPHLFAPLPFDPAQLVQQAVQGVRLLLTCLLSYGG
jgi:hypothetical protein